LSSVIAIRPPIIAPAPRPVTRDAQRAPAPAARAARPRVVTIPGSLKGHKQVADTLACDPMMSGIRVILEFVSESSAGCRRPGGFWGRPATDDGPGWAVVDVETSGFRPGHARVVSIAALALGDDGNVEKSLYTLLNPGVDPGPTHVHGLTAEMLEGQPVFADIVGDLTELLRGRTLVAHNVGFDYSFLTAEAEMVEAELPIDTAMCTVELSRRLELGTDNLRLETLAAHWGITQMRPHDALDDAMVLAQILKPVLVRARERKVWLPIRPLSRRQWPNGQVTHEELRPLKQLAARLPCPYMNPGRFVAGRPLVQGMRVALSAEVARTHEELIERIVDAGLSYTESVDPQTSLILCNEAEPDHGKGYQANELGVPLVTDEDFVRHLDAVIGGAAIEEFTDMSLPGEQFALF
jgi:DNA polymerase-3 subunit epsilon